ncbi:SWIM zinc finger family protein [Fibrobacter sp. UWB12]
MQIPKGSGRFRWNCTCRGWNRLPCSHVLKASGRSTGSACLSCRAMMAL